MSGVEDYPTAEAVMTKINQLENSLRESQMQAQRTEQLLAQIWTKLEKLETVNPPRNRSPDAASHDTTPLTLNPSPRPTPHSLIKPALPDSFDGARTSGKAFLTSCHLYFNLCADQFPDDQIRINWVLSFMKADRAASFAQGIHQRQISTRAPVYKDWEAFEKEFRIRFCPRDEATAAMNKLEGVAYYQGRKPVDDYIDQFEELVTEAGYTEGRVIVMKFRKGLDGMLQDRIAEMGVDRPASDDPAGWYEAARRFDANRAANRAFNATGRHGPSATAGNVRPPLPTMRPVPTATSSYVPPSRPLQAPPTIAPPRPPPAGPVPMDVDTLRRKRAVPGACYRCGSTEHLMRDCPRTFDVRAIPVEEQVVMLEQLLAAADVRATGGAPTGEYEDEQEEQGLAQEETDQAGFGSGRG